MDYKIGLSLEEIIQLNKRKQHNHGSVTSRRSHYSNRSNRSYRSYRSNKSNRSNKSYRSNKSNQSNRSYKSNRSNRSYRSQGNFHVQQPTYHNKRYFAKKYVSPLMPRNMYHQTLANTKRRLTPHFPNQNNRILAQYKFIRTAQGLQRVLVPVKKPYYRHQPFRRYQERKPNNLTVKIQNNLRQPPPLIDTRNYGFQQSRNRNNNWIGARLQQRPRNHGIEMRSKKHLMVDLPPLIDTSTNPPLIDLSEDELPPPLVDSAQAPHSRTISGRSGLSLNSGARDVVFPHRQTSTSLNDRFSSLNADCYDY